ncbi:MAG: EscU/YscU/HrcU family type III secretion system export apparatus switch protein [Planctomycetales bacterium]|nr:EscU/YscU/HrcU family type III secretion system export apparatus switch protein [Planctomycetales bacterium]
MAEDAGQSRTEAATPRRREEARRKGQVPYSADLSTSFTLFLSLSVLWFLSPVIGGQLAQIMRNSLGDIQLSDWNVASTRTFMAWLIRHNIVTTGLLAGVAFVAALVAGVSQAGFRITFEPLSPNWNRLNPASGWGRLLSVKSGVKALMACGKACLAGAVAWWLIRSTAGQWGAQRTLHGAVSVAWFSGLKLALILSGVMLALAALDYIFQRTRHEADLRMTRQEVIEERRNEEVDPQIRARMRRLQREAALNRALSSVPNATVVVTNPTHYAVALRYERGETEAPVILAKGKNALAKRIMALAEENGVPVLRRPPVARALYALGEIGEPIPDTLFQAVAEILAFVYAQRRGQRPAG